VAEQALAAAFGALILIFQDGRLQSLLGHSSEGALDLTIPLVLAALVFSISTTTVRPSLRNRPRREDGHGSLDPGGEGDVLRASCYVHGLPGADRRSSRR
jgi:hypothetical protein